MLAERQAVFRCDAGPGIGLGHLSRCLALAEALAAMEWSCCFAVGAPCQDAGLLATSGFETVRLGRWDDASCLQDALTKRADLLVIDHYGLDLGYEDRCRALAGALLVYDDAPTRQHRCDLLVDAAAGRSSNLYDGLVPEQCRLLLGRDYVCLRASFAAARQRSLARRKGAREVSQIFVNFGGTDSHGLCNVALAALARVDRALNIDVTIGAAARYLDTLHEIAAESPHDVTIHLDATNVDDLLISTDMAIGAAGINAWERCVLGVPSVLMAVVDNQRSTYEAITEGGAALGAGDASGDVGGRLYEAALKLIGADEARAAISRKAAAFCDGSGAHRVATAVSERIQRDRLEFSA